ncbi:hypothetical protein ACQP1O_15310 [Nocardia sp. CA-151230]|uniref:hypothetical protein n=1 Tax=Nocardia sp. CA-151230 TaxID=3239982 RepID=UPI003D9493C7
MIRLRVRRRSPAIAGAVCLAAAAPVAVSVPVETAGGPIPVHRDHREHATPLPIRAGAVANSAPEPLVAQHGRNPTAPARPGRRATPEHPTPRGSAVQRDLAVSMGRTVSLGLSVYEGA